MNYSIMAEQTVLGAILTDPERLSALEGILEPEHFYVPVYGDMYRIMRKQFKEDDVAPFKIARELKDHPAFSGDENKVNETFREIAAAGLGHYDNTYKPNARYIYSLYAKRNLEYLGSELTKALVNGDEEQVVLVKEKMEKVSVKAPSVKTKTAQEQIRGAYKALVLPDTSMKTGFRQWDIQIGGISKGARTMLAAYGGAGKTAFALQVARYISKTCKVRYLDFENGEDKIWRRVFSQELKLSSSTMRNGSISDDYQTKITNGNDELVKRDFVVFYKPQTVGEMIDLCGECDLIVVDGISSFPCPPEFSKIDKVGWVGDQCSKLSDHTGAGILMLSHVNSDSMKAGPSMAGIYGGQVASFDPEVIVEMRAKKVEVASSYRTIEMMALKSRYGEQGVKMSFNFHGDTMTFSEGMLPDEKKVPDMPVLPIEVYDNA